MYEFCHSHSCCVSRRASHTQRMPARKRRLLAANQLATQAPACTATAPIGLARRHASIPSSDFDFDAVLGPGASQSDVYHAAVKPVVEDVLNG